MATYYLDLDSGNDSNDGSTTALAFLTYDQAIETTDLSAGDKVVVRRGTTQTATSDIAFNDDGARGNPIVIEADYDDNFEDNDSVSQQATLTFGSKTVTFAADVSSEVTAHDWIWVSSDDNRKHAYEVESVSTSTVTLYLPFKGSAGSSKSIGIMPPNPIWNDGVSSYNWIIDGDYNFRFQGIWIKGVDANGCVSIDDVMLEFRDCIFSDNAENEAISNGLNGGGYFLRKCRSYNCKSLISSSYGLTFDIKNCLIDGGTSTGSSRYGISLSIPTNGVVEETEFKNHEDADVYFKGGCRCIFRNCTFNSTTKINTSYTTSIARGGLLAFEDFDNTKGDNRDYTSNSVLDDNLFESDESTLRTGGGETSIKVKPNTGLGGESINTAVLLDYPISLGTDETTVKFYLNGVSTGEWTANPTADELYIDVSYFKHATNTFRGSDKSTETVDFINTAGWSEDNTISITFTPAQSGLAYIRLIYGKSKESGNNIFYVDTKPVIS